jgi:benzoylformate decarboxylase
MNVAEYLLDLLSSIGVRFIFGNPGTTEIALVCACQGDSRPEYVVGLSEAACVAMADGYARVQRSLGVVNLHVAPGLGNAMGGIYTASKANTPLLVVVGAQDLRHDASSPVLDGPMDSMVRPLVKDVFTLTDAHQAPLLIRRAVRTALTPPMGPVALICPMDVMNKPVADEFIQVTAVQLGGLGHERTSEVVEVISRIVSPAIIVTEEVYWRHAETETMALAEVLSAPIYVAPYIGVLPVDASFPLFAGFIPPSRAKWSMALREFDGLIFLGGTGLRPTLFSEGTLPQLKISIGADPNIVGGDGEFALSYIADIRLALVDMLDHLKGLPDSSLTKRRPRIDFSGLDSMHPTRIMDTILTVRSEALIVDESGLSTTDVKALLNGRSGSYVANGSGGIGWGLPAMVGAMFAERVEGVIGLIGDGSAPYAAEALWTASHWRKTGAQLIIFNNGKYGTLNVALSKLMAIDQHEAFDIGDPSIDFRGLAMAYGWDYILVTQHDDLLEAMARFSGPTSKNCLIDIRLLPSLVPLTASDHF